MPISRPFSIKRISQEEFGSIAYSVMEHVFAIHQEFGRFFEERIYKQELANRMHGVALEVPVTILFDSFSKNYSLDVLVHESALFEFKSAENLHLHHRQQTINYLFAADLAHAKLINIRTDMVQHEFVNCTRRLADLRHPNIVDSCWNSRIPLAAKFRELLASMVCDWGTGLELSLYEQALTHFFGGEVAVHVRVPVFGAYGQIGHQRMRLITPETAFKLTAFPEIESAFASHARRMIAHTQVTSILWANISHHEVTFTTIR